MNSVLVISPQISIMRMTLNDAGLSICPCICLSLCYFGIMSGFMFTKKLPFFIYLPLKFNMALATKLCVYYSDFFSVIFQLNCYYFFLCRF